jgi:hypothetical protein
MFVTSFTTSAAFYANVVSDITAIRLFGIFSGTSILIMYSLMITWFPAGVVFMEKRRNPRNAVPRTENVEMHENPMKQKPHPTPGVEEAASSSPPKPSDVSEAHPGNESTEKARPPSDGGEFATSESDKSENSPVIPADAPAVIAYPAGPFACYSKFREKCAAVMRNVFEKWIPSILRGYPIWLILLLALGIGMACAVTVSPGLQRPKSADFQVFSSSHILEQYDLNYKSKFRLEQTAQDNFYVYIFFGFKAEDSGNYLDPKNFGKLQYDDSFDILRPEAQKWFLTELCPGIRKLKFFGRSIKWPCYPEVVFVVNQCVCVCGGLGGGGGRTLEIISGWG